MREIVAFTDGSAVVSGQYAGLGGYGAYITEKHTKSKYFSKGFKNTKTGRMEISALLCVLKQMPVDEEVELIVYSDSQYVVKSFTEGWLRKWERAEWIKVTGEDVKNRDLWQKVMNEVRKRPKLHLRMRHVKGHQVNKAKKEERKELLKDPIIKGNAIADLLADYKRHKHYQKDLL